MRSLIASLLFALVLGAGALAQQQPETTKTTETPKTREKKKPEPSSPTQAISEPKPGEQPAPFPEATPDTGKESASEKDKEKEEHDDMTEVAPVVTHHQVTLDGKLLKYTATAGRLPIKRGDGKIEAEMFFVAYTLDGQDAGKRPLTFAFNGGPGSATIWLHMGALGAKRVMMQ